jgi:hypothetical protein
MATIQIDSADVTDAENFLEEYLTDSIEDGDFSKGTALRDLTVGALAAVFAYLKKENAIVKNMQSLETVENAVDETDTEALDDAVTAILSNWFISRKAGAKARGSILCHVSQLTDVFIRTSVKFYKTANLSFVVDSSDTYFVAKEDLIPVINSDGDITEYQFTVPVVATGTGEGYNISPGLFVSFDSFNPYVTIVENLDTFAGGKGVETTQEILSRAPTAISVRNLINQKSIQAVLGEEFPELKRIMVAGYGDTEMTRDVLTGVSTHLAVHVGGATDVYLDADLVQQTFTGLVGAGYLRPDNKAVIFKDATLTGTRKFTDSPAVEIGDIIRITDGLVTVPAEYRVTAVREDELEISERTPFPKATDEEPLLANQFVSYTIGRVGPAYVDIVSDVGNIPFTTGQTSRRVTNAGRVTLPGGPVMSIDEVVVIDPDTNEIFKNPTDGFVHFTERVSVTPEDVTDPTQPLQYQILVNNPKVAQSTRQWMEVVVGPDGDATKWDTKTVRVKYKTLSGFSAVDSFVTDRYERVACADVLARGMYPVTLSMAITCKLKSTATSVLDTDDVVTDLVSFINAFDTTAAPIDVSAIIERIRDNFADIGAVLPFNINYSVGSPDGELLTYATTDEVIVDTTKQTGGDPLDLAVYGVTTRLLKYLTSNDNITVTLV